MECQWPRRIFQEAMTYEHFLFDSAEVVVLKMAPLDLDKYVEIARQCKYLPENDLKVSKNVNGKRIRYVLYILRSVHCGRKLQSEYVCPTGCTVSCQANVSVSCG